MKSKTLTFLCAFLCAFLPKADLWAQASNPFPNGGALTSSSPRMVPLLNVAGDMADGVAVPFTIPERPHPSFTHFEWEVHYRWIALVGGQNRSGAAHPGYDLFSGSSVNLWHWFVDADGHHALPGMGTSRAISFEWGETQPATPEQFVPNELIDQHADDPSVYWGPRPFNPDVPQEVHANYVLEPGGWLTPEPGQEVWLVTQAWWNVEGWPLGTHEWTGRVDWNETIVAYGRWVTP